MLKKGGVVATDPDDIINFYKIAYPFLCNVEFDSPALEDEYTFNSNLGECENAILKLLSVSPEKSETISEKLDFSASETASALTMLEMLGTIEEVNGYFKIV
jgi:predicted Rossmann fold nucleotide-binding protein DprA/Smf involved in DNA uptake